MYGATQGTHPKHKTKGGNKMSNMKKDLSELVERKRSVQRLSQELEEKYDISICDVPIQAHVVFSPNLVKSMDIESIEPYTEKTARITFQNEPYIFTLIETEEEVQMLPEKWKEVARNALRNDE
jgi:hypothetical protein